MLIACPECSVQVSDKAATCPSCGVAIAIEEAAPKASPISAGPRPAVFTGIAVVAVGLALFTPRILLFFPVMVAIGSAVIGFARREQWRTAGTVAGVAALALFALSEADMAAPTSANLSAAEIASWNWTPDQSFGEHGTIKWNVLVQNKTDKPLSSVKVDFTSYDAAGKILASTFTYVDAIPPGGTQSADSYADLYGGEARADVKISEVRYSQ